MQAYIFHLGGTHCLLKVLVFFFFGPIMCHLSLMNIRRKSDLEMKITRLNFREHLSVYNTIKYCFIAERV